MENDMSYVSSQLVRRAGWLGAVFILICLCAKAVRADTPTLGPVVRISSPDPFASCSTTSLFPDAAADPMLAVNPMNPANMVAVWVARDSAGLASSATFDGGVTWLNQGLPDYLPCAGAGFDPWVTFAPNGNVFALGFHPPVAMSTDGGSTWPSNIPIIQPPNGKKADKPTITADPYDSRYVYAAWVQFTKGLFPANNCETIFARTTDGGQSWTTQSIHHASGTDFNWGHQIQVLPDGTVICAFCEGSFQNNHQASLSIMRSTDHGQTWTGPSNSPAQLPLIDTNFAPPNALISDPDTGHAVEAHPMFDSIAVDRNNGTLYAVWLDARFSGFKINGIALSMSCDGGITWSDPIQVNRPPSTIPLANQQAWNPTVQVTTDGTVAVTYYDFRFNTPAPGALTDYWMAYWRPSPTAPITNTSNWREIRLTDSSFDIEQAAGRAFERYAYYVGLYEGLAATPNGVAAVWAQPFAGSSDQVLFRQISFK